METLIVPSVPAGVRARVDAATRRTVDVVGVPFLAGASAGWVGSVTLGVVVPSVLGAPAAPGLVGVSLAIAGSAWGLASLRARLERGWAWGLPTTAAIVALDRLHRALVRVNDRARLAMALAPHVPRDELSGNLSVLTRHNAMLRDVFGSLEEQGDLLAGAVVDLTGLGPDAPTWALKDDDGPDAALEQAYTRFLAHAQVEVDEVAGRLGNLAWLEAGRGPS